MDTQNLQSGTQGGGKVDEEQIVDVIDTSGAGSGSNSAGDDAGTAQTS